ncbi:MAG: YeeE/YedE family protein [Hyphomicrobiales bacterium]|nr:YeeE/YedE family protein [Hyphomicrobiales bacterium]
MRDLDRALPHPRAALARTLPALAGFALLAALAGAMGGPRLALLALIGLMAGMALYHASFGFTAAWRRFILERRGAGLRAQILLLGATSLAFFPLLGMGELFGRPLDGFVFPIGWALLLGAFLFGIGMQLGGGCGSGTLFTIGGGSARMVVTLAFFILGSTLATAWSDHWLAWPDLPPLSFIAWFGWPAALGAMLAALALLFALVRAAERARHGDITPIHRPETRWLTGPWSLAAGALALAGVNVAVLLVQGWPWGITSAFALWGSKLAALIGFAPAQWAYWRGQEAVLAAPILADPTSVTDFGIMLGALLAARAAGKFRPSLAIPARSLAAAMLGGLLLGIGARLGTGCNIGAFFSGTVSGSLHGWVWLVFAFAGNIIGVRLRPVFRLD